MGVWLKATGDQTHVFHDREQYMVNSKGLVEVPQDAADVLVPAHGFAYATEEDLAPVAVVQEPKGDEDLDRSGDKAPAKGSFLNRNKK